jgi:magnesium chelatase subunit I
VEVARDTLTRRPIPPVLPYSLIVGQDRVKLALELAYVAPAISGVLLSGQRGTAKSTAVRAFARMAYGTLPVTLPINATDDRVIGGWDIDALMRGKAKPRPGLLEEAGSTGMLYIDEVNLLDDHIVNLILDVTSTGILPIQREMLDRQLEVSFTLVGTMNPEEGGLRPQLLDRFALMVPVEAERDLDRRRKILETVLRFDEARRTQRRRTWLERGLRADAAKRERLERARNRFDDTRVPREIARRCALVADEFDIAGHRGEYVTALAAQADAALHGLTTVRVKHVADVAPMALVHRTQAVVQGGAAIWSGHDNAKLEAVLYDT